MRVVVAAVCGVLVSLALPTSGWAQEPGSLEVAGGYSFLGDSELVDVAIGVSEGCC